jgi:hypothetical protein
MYRAGRFGMIALVLLAWLPGAAFAQQVPDNVKLERNVEFGKGGNRALKMHIAYPKDLPEGLLPVIVTSMAAPGEKITRTWQSPSLSSQPSKVTSSSASRFAPAEK